MCVCMCMYIYTYIYCSSNIIAAGARDDKLRRFLNSQRERGFLQPCKGTKGRVKA